MLAHSAQRRRWVSSLLTAAALLICGGALSAQTAGSDYTVKAGDTLSGIAQAAYGDMTLWGGVWEANKAKLPSAANPHNLPAGTVLSLPRFDTEAAKTSARNARHAAPAFTGTGSGAAVPANVKPVPYGEDYGINYEYLPIAFTKRQFDALPSTKNGKTYGGTSGWHIAGASGEWGESNGLIEAITEKNPELLKYALAEYGSDPEAGMGQFKPPVLNYSFPGEEGYRVLYREGTLPSGAVVRYVLVRAVQ